MAKENGHSHTHEDYYRLPKDIKDLLVLTIAATPQELALYEQYKHFLDIEDIDGEIITANRLMRWAQDPAREFICVFCGKPPLERNGVPLYCRICDSYKGIMPNCPE